MYDSKKILSTKIQVVFNENNKKVFPDNYINNVKYWGNISKEKLHSCLPDGTAKLLTLDLDVGDECSLRCPHCFRRDSRFDKCTNPLTYDEIIKYVKDAKELGLEEIKILGRGEPFQNKDFLKFLREMTKLDLGVSVFTKGFVIGDDNLVKTYNSHYGINTGKELVKELYKLKVSILLGFNSFDKEVQENFVGACNSVIKNYTELRDRALILLCNAGFNKYVAEEATRLAMIAAPIKPENINEVFEIYKWGRLRNIYILSCPTTISGKGIDEFNRAIETYRRDTNNSPYLKYVSELERLYTSIYSWNIQTNLISKKLFTIDIISLYPGCHVCNQVAAGFYLNLSGQINQCPGRCDQTTIFCSNIRDAKSLKEVWVNSLNYKRAKYSTRYNFGCVARDGHSLPVDFYNHIYQNVLNNNK